MEWLGQNCSWQAQQHANRIMDARDALGEERIIDVHYANLARQPIETMRALYQSLGDEFTAQAEAGMRAWLADNPQDKFGRAQYKLANRVSLRSIALLERTCRATRSSARVAGRQAPGGDRRSGSWHPTARSQPHGAESCQHAFVASISPGTGQVLVQ